MEAILVTITPEFAGELLENNPRNRPLKRGHLALLCEEMREKLEYEICSAQDHEMSIPTQVHTERQAQASGYTPNALVFHARDHDLSVRDVLHPTADTEAAR